MRRNNVICSFALLCCIEMRKEVMVRMLVALYNGILSEGRVGQINLLGYRINGKRKITLIDLVI